MATDYLVFYSTIQQSSSYVVSSSSMLSVYTYPKNIGILKKLGNVQIIVNDPSRMLFNGTTYDSFNLFELNEDKFEVTRPLEYTEDFYSKFSAATLPLQSSSVNSITGKYFYQMYPYYTYLIPPSTFSIQALSSSNVFIIKDIYLNYNANTAYLLLPPASYFGAVGYRVFINGNMLVPDQTLLQPLPSNYKSDFDMSDLLPIMTTQLQRNYDWYNNPVNINNMFSIGHNRLQIELIFDSSVPLVYSDGNLSFQMDLIINNNFIVFSGLYSQNNPMKQQYMTLQNTMLALNSDNTVMVYTDPTGFVDLSMYITTNVTILNGQFTESYNVSYLNWTVSYSGGIII